MKEQEKYIAKQIRLDYEKKIKNLEAKLVDKKLGATTTSGHCNYDFIAMMRETRKLLDTTKSLGEDVDFTNMKNDNDLTVGDVK